ncbi:MAG: hypothetical protein ABWJ42_05955 [Sulfolobales archaeon]
MHSMAEFLGRVKESISVPEDLMVLGEKLDRFHICSIFLSLHQEVFI